MSSTFQPLPRSWAERLIERLRMLYGDSFDRKWAGMSPDAMVDCWAEELAGYTADELKRGLADLKGRAFPPSLPEFCEMCRPSQSPEELFYEAVKQMRARQDGKDKWPSPELFWAAAEMGADILSYPYEKLKSRWSACLSMHKGATEAIPEAPKALPAPAGVALAPEVREAVKGAFKGKRGNRVFVSAACANYEAVLKAHWGRADALGIEPEYADDYKGPRITLAMIRAQKVEQ